MKRNTSLAKKLLIRLVVLVLIATVTIGVLFSNPQWLLPVINQVTKQQEHGVHFHQMAAHWKWPNYHLQTTFSVADKRISSQQADATVALNFAALWQKEHSLFDTLQLKVNDAVIDVEALTKGRESTSTDYFRFLPDNWTIDCKQCQIQRQTQHIESHIVAKGRGDQVADMVMDAKTIGTLSARYSATTRKLLLSSPQLAIEKITGYPVQLQQMAAEIDLLAPWQSHINSSIVYSDGSSQITLKGVGENQWRFDSLSDGKRLSITATRDAEQLLIDSEMIDLKQLSAIKPIMLALLSDRLSVETSQFLQQVNADGKLQVSLSLQLDEQGNPYRLTRVTSRLDDVSLTYAGSQFSHLSGSIHYDDDKVAYRLTLQNSELRYLELFDEPLQHLTGQVNGLFDIKNQKVSIEELTLQNKDFDRLILKGSLALVAPLTIDVSGTLDNLSLPRLSLYLSKAFPSKTQSWLKKALLAGKKNQTTFVLTGDIQRFLKDKDFVLQVDTTATEGVFHYLNNNPDIGIENVRVRLDRRQLSVQLDKGFLFNTINKKIIKVPLSGSATIADTRAVQVAIKAKITAQPANKLLPLAARSVVRRSIKKVKKIVDLKGDFSLDLGLNVDVREEPTHYDLSLQLASDNASATLRRYPTLPVNKSRVQGLITQAGLQNLSINGRLLKQPVAITLAPETAKKSKKPTGLSVRVKAKKAVASQLLPRLNLINQQQAQALSKYGVIDGRSDYTVEMNLDHSGTLQRLTVSSDLENTAISAFGLLTKYPSEKMPLSLQYRASNRQLHLAIGEYFAMQLGLDKKGNIQGFSVNSRNSRTDYREKFGHVVISAKHFDYAAAKAFHEVWFSQQEKPQEKLDIEPQKKTEWAYQFDVNIDNVVISDTLSMPFATYGSLEKIHLNSPLITGQMYYQPGALQAKITQLDIGALFELLKKEEVNPEGRPVVAFSLANALPALDVEVDNVMYKSGSIGRAVLHTSSKDGYYSIDQVLLQGNTYYVDISGYESNEPRGVVTHISADFKGEHLRNVIQQFQLNDVLSARFMDVSLNVSWPGRAHTFNLRQGYGKASLNAKNVRFINISSGLGSIVGVMDIMGIVKRLMLDFSNLTDDKLYFDTIVGDWNIGGGRAMTRNLHANGSVVELQVEGAADLYRRVFDDIELTVIPQASNILPIIGAVAGGLVGGAAGLLMQHTVGDGIDRAMGFPYVISGTWQSPVIESR